jgi:serine/threonine protein kinase
MDNQPYDSKTDVWSLGCILYELVTLAPPFQAKGLAALVMQIVSHPPPQIPSVYSGELDALARKLLAKDPSVSVWNIVVCPGEKTEAVLPFAETPECTRGPC